ncbi:ISAzo13-like element transposase-related protein [Streptomyces sp. NBC_01171]|uniref:ISAzo13-like element transposase-related protein n=1 Tax=Streptomyces sp. NBC_01171 TaxID=2903757 RepID=UPI0038641CAD
MTSPTRSRARQPPPGIYDVAANTDWVNVGTDHDTAAFAVESTAAGGVARAGQLTVPSGPAHRDQGRPGPGCLSRAASEGRRVGPDPRDATPRLRDIASPA